MREIFRGRCSRILCCIFSHQWRYVELNNIAPNFANIECDRCSATDVRWLLPDDIRNYDQEAVLNEYQSLTGDANSETDQ